MSIKLMTVVWELDLPPGEKLVLLALADQANDAGTHCWPSVATIAKRSGQNERTVRRALRSLETKGHLTCNERRGTSTNYVVHPGHDAPPDKLPPRTKTTQTPDTTPPHPGHHAPQTINEPLEPSKRQKARAVDHELPDDWQPQPFGLNTESRKLVDGWPPGEAAIQLEQFRAHHGKKGDKFKDWQKAWSTWVLNSRNFRRQQNGKQSDSDGAGRTGRAMLAVENVLRQAGHH